MGVSTDAILIWGFNVDRDDDYDACELLDTFCDERYSDLDKAEETHGGRLAHHCANTHTCYIVGLSKRAMRVSRGYPEEVVSLETDPDAQAKLDGFAKALGVEPQPGRWLLASYWG